jgi:hypothetical protein
MKHYQVRQHGHRIRPECTPRWLRPKLTEQQRKELCMVHHQNLDAIASGTATAHTMWDWAGACLTWSRVAEAIGKGMPEMQQQLALVDSVIDLFERTRRVAFATEADYQLAVDGVVAMDLLAQATDAYSAGLAADWSEAEINKRAEAATV